MPKTKYASAIIVLPDSRLLIHSLAGSYYDKDAESELTVETYVTSKEDPYIEIVCQLRRTLGLGPISDFFDLRYSFTTEAKTRLGMGRQLFLFFLQQKAQCQFKVEKPNTLDILTVEDALTAQQTGKLNLGITGATALKVTKNMFDNNLSN